MATFPGSPPKRRHVGEAWERGYSKHDGNLAPSDQFQDSNELCLPPIVPYYDLPSVWNPS